MGLAKYQKMRDFGSTPEPRGKVGAKRRGDSFVVQKHAASRLHYDFRLEMEGVLRSWAVPKGPSLVPGERRLAVHVEDHPIDYGGFEGVIPEGQYGGGSVIVWDRGTWRPEGDPVASYRAGKMKFELDGEKLHGGFALVRMEGEDGKNWLLMKHSDEHALKGRGKKDVTVARPESVVTGRTVEQVAVDRDREWQSNRAVKKPEGKVARAKAALRETARGQRRAPAKTAAVKKGKPAPRRKKAAVRKARKPAPKSKKPDRDGATDRSPSLEGLEGARRGALPASIDPQLATLVSEPPEGEGWIHEIKFDGYRVLCRLDRGRVSLLSRNGKEWSDKFTSIAEDAAQVPATEAILDGEVVAQDASGVTSFQALQRALSPGGSTRLSYQAFDVLFLDGHDLRGVPQQGRKAILAELLGGGVGRLRPVDHVEGRGGEFFEQACAHGLEGIISKRADAPYRAGRGKDWLKIRCKKSQELVIGGYTEPSGARSDLGALLVGVHDDKGLRFAGKVGTGFTDQLLEQLRRKLAPLERSQPPFVDPPRGASARGVHWVEPKLVAQVEFAEWTSDGKLRHPSFQGLREDKRSRDVVRETPKEVHEVPTKRKTTARKRSSAPPAPAPAPRKRSAKKGEDVEVGGVRITNPGRVLYPDVGITKLEVARYYESIADWILPHVGDRPLTLVRCPEGQAGACFYQKHAMSGLPDVVGRVPIREKTSSDDYLYVRDVKGLLTLVQFGVLEFHAWGSRVKDVERPDLLVFDLDPDPSVSWERVVSAARDVKDTLADLGLESFLKTTGGKGLHACVPLVPRADWDEAKAFCKSVVERMARETPGAYTTVLSKEKRKGRIFLDYLRNGRGATAVVAYSTRARKGAPVAAPVRWDELSPSLRPDAFGVANLPGRLSRLKRDPWTGFFDVKQSLTKALRAAVSR